MGIPLHSTYKVQFQVKTLDVEACVSELIDDNLKCWKDRLLQTIFSAQEIETIQSIPFSLHDRDDQLIWDHTSNNNFDIKSAYHLHSSLQAQSNGEPSENNKYVSVWLII